jgi:exopolysaccharide/PEP-CTERM locus tyrosine autokinase
MSSLIERAGERLEQLRQAGAVIPPYAQAPVGQQPGEQAAPALVDPYAERSTLPNSTSLPHLAGESGPSGEFQLPRQSQRVDFDLDALAAANLATPNAPRSQVADEFRVLKRPLINNVKTKGAGAPAHANLVMVTSAVAGEGKSFTAINLAMSIAAELDHTVMLVDADLARPSLPRMLGIAEGPGLLDLLEGTAEIPDVLLRTNIEKLTVLRSGTPHSKATELLASEAMRRLLDELLQRYSDRIIVFDSPPLLLTTEARALAMYMGQVVFVIRSGKTLQTAVEQALATIEACPLKMMMLNQVRTEKRGLYGEYGLGYGYGYGYGGERTARGA